ncbi:sigma-70 family RNA polymerase sigma factor [Nocardioides sp.]|uniref:sigma-70 family RNA polymerase sigma factor n=1 Tax=Nocardioides sp. TaxID=35761 RepID=UPI002CB12D15|nr:sigma-70 family RNA polymerase sigma factor [Nocardioides sp.]HXH77131.1 sigma-70 family RNA polymerase sigma factor [Nocardioides sp.]
MGHDLQQVFEASWRRLVGQLYAVCGDLTEAEEVVAEAFARAAARRRMFEGLDSPEAWLRVTAVNIARTRHRRRRVGERLGLSGVVGAAESRHPYLTDDRLAVVGALAQLPHVQREALALHYLADQSVADVAATLGVPIGTVKARLSRGRVALAAVLGETELLVEGESRG